MGFASLTQLKGNFQLAVAVYGMKIRQFLADI